MLCTGLKLVAAAATIVASPSLRTALVNVEVILMNYYSADGEKRGNEGRKSIGR